MRSKTKRVQRTTRTRQVRDEDYRRLADFRHAVRLFLEFSGTAARDVGLTPQQHQALLAIKGLSVAGDVSVSDLAGRLIQRHHSTVELIDRLGELGLVKRSIDPADRRRVRIVLTPKAERLLKKLSAAHIGELQRLRPALEQMLEALE